MPRHRFLPFPLSPLLPLLLLALLTGCSSTPAVRSNPELAVLKNDSGVTLPTRRCASYFLLDVKLNGRGPFTMILDTGASQTVVSPRVADMLKDDARPANMYAEGSQGKRQDVDRILSIHSLTIGDAELRDLEAITLDLSKIQATIGSNIDGILGYPAFKSVLLTVDYPGAAVRIAKGSLPPVDGSRVLALVAEQPVVEARMAGRSRRFLLDTGKAGAFSVRDFDRQHFAAAPATIAQCVAIGGSYTLCAARLDGDIRFGDITFERPVIESSDASDLIGAEALKSFAVTFDQAHKRVSVTGPADRIVRASPVRGIGVGFDFSKGGWTVDHVYPGLPAEAAGIQPGDWIVRLGGKRMWELSCMRQMDLFDSGDSIDITLLRQRERMEVRVPIVTLVP